MLKAVLKDVASWVPSQTLTNEDLAATFPEWTAEKIYAKTGIRARPIAEESQCASDLAVAAAERLFHNRPATRDEVDFVVFCSQSPDYFLPTSACLIQDRLGLPTAVGAIDINQGCSGFVYGLAVAKGLIEAGLARGVLLLTAETYSKFINPKDKSTRTLFGDAGAAALVGVVDSDREHLGPFVFGTDGRGAENLIVPAGGMRRRPSARSAEETADEGGNVRSANNLFMNGAEIFTFTLRSVPDAVTRLLSRWGRGLEEVDLFVFHQANRFMLEKLRDKLKIPPGRFWLDLAETGNTVSATIPIALEQARAGSTLTQGQNVMLVGFGVGYSWGACMVNEVYGG